MTGFAKGFAPVLIETIPLSGVCGPALWPSLGRLERTMNEGGRAVN
jgi:hypothetical protein